MRVLGVAAVLSCLAAMPVVADDYACRAIGRDEAVTLNFSLRYSSGAYAVMGAAFQIEGDIGYATDAAEPTAVATIAGVEATQDRVRFRLRHKGGGFDGTVAEVHIVTLSEGAHMLTAGVLHVVAGGLWPIECEIAS